MQIDISKMVVEIRERRPDLSWRSLGELIGVQGRTLQKISDGITTTPNFNTYRSISLFYYKNDLQQAIPSLSGLFPDKEKIITKEIELLSNYKHKDLQNILLEILASKEKWYVFALVNDVKEVAISEFEKLGLVYAKACYELHEKEFLTIKNGKVYPTQKDPYSINTAKERLSVLENFLFCINNKKKLGTADPKSILGVLNNGFNEKGQELIIEYTYEFYEKILNLHQNPDYRGSIPIATAVLTSRYDISKED